MKGIHRGIYEKAADRLLGLVITASAFGRLLGSMESIGRIL